MISWANDNTGIGRLSLLVLIISIIVGVPYYICKNCGMLTYNACMVIPNCSIMDMLSTIMMLSFSIHELK